MDIKKFAASTIALLMLAGSLTACDQPPQQESQAPAAGEEQPTEDTTNQ
jgi:hypothetical protein